MNDLIFIPIPIREFESKMSLIVEEKVRSIVAEFQKDKVSPVKEYWTRNETAKRLRISLPTLNELTKDGTLDAYRIGGRVLYKPEEVEAALCHISTTKYKRRSLIDKTVVSTPQNLS